MKIAYFDCPTGLSGNMILAAFLDAGLSLSYLIKELKKLKLEDYALKLSNVSKSGFKAKLFKVATTTKERPRNINDVYKIIVKSKLKKSIKELSKNIFERLFKAESKVHGEKRVHLHELGGIDAMIDIVGTAIGLDKVGISEVYCSPLPFGFGPIKSAHGTLPNPAPATAELLKDVPIYKKKVKGELVTPTGAAIITTIAKSFTNMPKLKLKKTGLGAGTFNFSEPNILRLFIGEAEVSYNEDLILAIETNIDNMNPELYDHVIGKLMRAGALDAYITQARMKKKRPGFVLTVLTDQKNKIRLIDAIFNETTTLGVRTYLIKREKLERETRKVKIKYGKVLVKIGKLGNIVKTISPEYKSCASLSKKTGVPLKRIYDETKAAAFS